MFRSNIYFYISVFCFVGLLIVLFMMEKLKNDDKQPFVISSREFYEAYKPVEFSDECLNNSKRIQINKIDEFLINAYKQKYIGCTFDKTDGFGYQLWRFASLYGIGRDTNRLPYFEGQNLEQMINLNEFGTIFPMLHEVLQIKNPPIDLIRNVDYGNDNSEYIISSILLKYPEKYLKLNSNYLQSYKYFQRYQSELRKILKCGPTIQTSLKFFTNQLFGNDTSLKLCAHIRRGDFVSDSMLESREDFIIPAIDYAYQYLKDNNQDKNISLLFIGDDRDFIKNLTIKNNFHKIYIPKSQSRGKDLCLGINYCDSMILTASGSAFGWWISYLMKPNSAIFYNSKIGDNGNSFKDIYDFDLFPKEWIKLSIKNGKAIKETKWWRERIG